MPTRKFVWVLALIVFTCMRMRNQSLPSLKVQFVVPLQVGSQERKEMTTDAERHMIEKEQVHEKRIKSKVEEATTKVEAKVTEEVTARGEANEKEKETKSVTNGKMPQKRNKQERPKREAFKLEQPLEEEEKPRRDLQEPSPAFKFNAERPLFVLSLPNNGDYSIPRFFECGGYNATKMGRIWTGLKEKKSGFRVPKYHSVALGECMRRNMENDNKPILEGCGDPKHVYADLQHMAAPYLKNAPTSRPPKCFDPVLHPGALENLYKQYPNATVMNVVRDPMEWARTLSKPFLNNWNEWCNPTHNNSFPTGQELEEAGSAQDKVVKRFYLQYQKRVKRFIKEHPTWNFVQVDWNADAQATGKQLQSQLGISSRCWAESTGNAQMIHDPEVPTVLADQVRPNHVAWPMLITAMPKAGTTTLHNYFRCGLGRWVGAHQWTNLSPPPHKGVQIGTCMRQNTNNDVWPFLKDCGHALVWSDTGVLQGRGNCYYPQIHSDGLERFYKSYPHGTILNAVRNTQSWVSSAFRWKDMPNRWVGAKCKGFPTSFNTTHEQWGEWYERIQDAIRQFARDHPTLTYIEVPLGEHTGTILNDIFHFPKQCWGHTNVNTNNREKPAAENATTTAGTGASSAAQ